MLKPSVIGQKDESQNGCFKKTKHAKFSEKRTFLTPWYAHVRFSENLACFVFLKHPFWDSPFCLITDETEMASSMDMAFFPLVKALRIRKPHFCGACNDNLFPTFVKWCYLYYLFFKWLNRPQMPSPNRSSACMDLLKIFPNRWDTLIGIIC